MAVTSGRGARSNATGRYEPTKAETFDDGWTETDATLPPRRTTLTPEHARKIITRNTSPDIGFDRSINPYKGCEHGCIYYPVRTGLDAGPADADVGFPARLPQAP